MSFHCFGFMKQDIPALLEIKLTLALSPHLPEKWKIRSQVMPSLLGGRGGLLSTLSCTDVWQATENIWKNGICVDGRHYDNSRANSTWLCCG